MSCKIICVAQRKGGTGKTTATLNLAAYLVKLGFRTLVCDLDSQFNATSGLGINPFELPALTSEKPTTMLQLLTEEKVKAKDIIQHTQDGIDLLPASFDMDDLVGLIFTKVGFDKLLAKKLHPIQESYDFILLDTPASLTAATINAMSAADYLLLPAHPEPYGIFALNQVVQKYQEVQSNSNPRLKILGVFITLFDRRSTGHKFLAGQIREEWGEDCFHTVIDRRVEILNSTAEGRTIVFARPNSDSAKEFGELTKEILQRVQR